MALLVCRLSYSAFVSYSKIYWLIGIAMSATTYAIGEPTKVTNDMDQIKQGPCI